MSTWRTSRIVVFPLAAAFLAGPLRAQHWMDAPRFATDNLDGFFEAVADVDGDGDLDVVSHVGPFFYPTAYRVFRNDGAGGFAPDPTVNLPATHQFFAVRPGLADVTGDGRPDLLFRAQGAGPTYGVAMFPNLGGGVFGAMVFAALSGGVIDLDVGDNDGDAALEIAVAHHATASSSSDVNVRWLDWNGAGFTLSSAVVIPQYVPTLEGVTSVEAFDFDGDARADIVTGSTYNTLIRRLATVAGQPQNGAPVSIPLNSPNGVMLTKGDVDGDGITDVLAVGAHIDGGSPIEWGHLMVLRFAAGGAFTAGPQTNVADYPVDYAANACALADWDEDGDLDLLSNTWTTSQGDEWKAKIGCFRRAANDKFALAAKALTYGPGAIAGSADLDGDGHADAVAPRAIVFGDGAFHDAPRVTPFSGYKFANVKLAVTDHEDDGDFDLLDADGRLLANDATGNLGTSQSDLQTLLPAAPPGFFWEDAAALGDFDGDGREDLVSPLFQVFVVTGIFQQMHLLHGAPNSKFVDAGPACAPGVRINDLGTLGLCLAADLDQDGDLDVVATDGYWPNQGAGFFGAFQPLFSGAPRGIADVDQDGDPDVLSLISVGVNSVDLRLARHDPGFAFSSSSLLTADLSTATGAFVDADEDGDLDVAAGGRADGAVHLLRNDPSGFTHVVVAGAPGAADVFGVTDVDGDGIADLVSATFADAGNPIGTPLVQVLRRTAPLSLSFEPARAFIAGSGRAFVDADQDGDQDLLGGVVVKNLRFDGVQDGRVRQYGKGTAGTGGAIPVLGAKGPFRPTSTTAEIRLRRGRGGASAIFFVSLAPAALPVGFGTTLLVQPPIPLVAVIPLSGAPGVAAAGEFTFDATPFVGLAAGLAFYHQAFVIDPAHPLGAAASNGLEIDYGP